MRSRAAHGMISPLLEFCLRQVALKTPKPGHRAGFFMPARMQKAPTRSGLFYARVKERATPKGAVTPKGDARSQNQPASQPRPSLLARAGRSLAENDKALQMLKDCRCGKCNRLLARVGEFTELQIKCSRCGTLNHEKAASLERSPLSDMKAESSANIHSTQ